MFDYSILNTAEKVIRGPQCMFIIRNVSQDDIIFSVSTSGGELLR